MLTNHEQLAFVCCSSWSFGCSAPRLIRIGILLVFHSNSAGFRKTRSFALERLKTLWNFVWIVRGSKWKHFNYCAEMAVKAPPPAQFCNLTVSALNAAQGGFIQRWANTNSELRQTDAKLEPEVTPQKCPVQNLFLSVEERRGDGALEPNIGGSRLMWKKKWVGSVQPNKLNLISWIYN